MNDEQNSIDELKKLDTNRRKKVDSFSLNIADLDDEDEIIFPEDDDDFGGEDSGEYEIDNFSVPSRNQLDDEKSEKKTARDEEKRRRQALKAEKKRKKRKAKQNGCVFRIVWAVLVLILGVFVAELLLVGINDLLGRNRPTEDEEGNEIASIIIKVPDSANIDQVAEILHENGVIESESYFKLYANLTKGTLQFNQGSYEMKNDMDYEAIINYLQSDTNRVDTVSLQFPEGMTVLEIAEKLGENGVCNKDQFLELCNSDDFDEDFTFLNTDRPKLSGVYYKLEGYLFPDTYEFYQGESAKRTIYRFLNNYEARVYYTKQRIEVKDKNSDDQNDQTGDTDTKKKNVKKYEKLTIEEQAKKQGMTMDEVLILASMIQAEAKDEADMYNISSVFHNRLKTLDNDGYTEFGEYIKGTLGSDPTVFYPYKKNTVPKNFESTYDTYKIKGLPAGPDCNPGLAAINAALYPNDTNYYFFCHKAATEDSEAVAYYAATIADHEYNLSLAGLK